MWYNFHKGCDSMPSWPVHIALANKLNKKLKLGDDFIIGNVIPDAMNGFIIKNVSKAVGHQTTHYSSGKGQIALTSFLANYQAKMKNPIIMGYFVHLLTDAYFNNYTHEQHIIIKDDKKGAILNDGTVSFALTPWQIKQDDFHKFGDQLILDKRLGNIVKLSQKTTDYLQDLNFLITNNDLEKIIAKINGLITKDAQMHNNYKMFTLPGLEEVLDNCYYYILDYLAKIK